MRHDRPDYAVFCDFRCDMMKEVKDNLHGLSFFCDSFAYEIYRALGIDALKPKRKPQ